MTTYKASNMGARMLAKKALDAVEKTTVKKASKMGRRSKEFWHCTASGDKVYFRGATGRSVEEARRLLHRQCHEKGCSSKVQLVDQTFMDWQRNEQEKKQEEFLREAFEEVRLAKLVVGRYGRILNQ